MELQNNVNKNVNNEDENVKKKRKRYTLCGKILIIIGFILINFAIFKKGDKNEGRIWYFS